MSTPTNHQEWQSLAETLLAQGVKADAYIEGSIALLNRVRGLIVLVLSMVVYFVKLRAAHLKMPILR